VPRRRLLDRGVFLSLTSMWLAVSTVRLCRLTLPAVTLASVGGMVQYENTGGESQSSLGKTEEFVEELNSSSLMGGRTVKPLKGAELKKKAGSGIF